jgi:hypothetical protein
MRFANHRLAKIIAGAALFAAGFGAGTWRTRIVEAQNRFGQPKTVLHVVVYKWKNFASQDDKDQAIKGIKTLAAQIPGIKNVWLKTQRNQIRDFDGVYAIEFASPEAAADTRRARSMKCGESAGKNCARTACRFRFPILRRPAWQCRGRITSRFQHIPNAATERRRMRCYTRLYQVESKQSGVFACLLNRT